MQGRSGELVLHVERLAAREGANPTRVPGVIAHRVSTRQSATPTLYSASLVFVVQGRKRGHLGSRTFDYGPGTYLVVTTPMPILCEIMPAGREPVLTLQIEIDLAMLRELVVLLDEAPAAHGEIQSVIAAPITPAIEAVLLRLLRELEDPQRARILAPQTVRALLFEALLGPHREMVLQVAAVGGRAARMAEVMRYMNAHFAEPLTIEQLARKAHMSVPTFHAHFKALAATSPLQYLKAIRLTKARLLLASTDTTAKQASYRVGYQSESQFSREYRRFFGNPPVESVRDDRARVLAHTPAQVERRQRA